MNNLQQKEIDLQLKIIRTFDIMIDSIDGFCHSLSLFDFAFDISKEKPKNDFSPEKRRYEEWCMIAVRDGAVKIYNFGIAIKLCIDTVKKCNEIKQEVEYQDIENIFEEFETYFPDWKGCRDASTHGGEIYIEERKKHNTKDDYVSEIIVSPPGLLITLLNGRKFSTSWKTGKNQVVSYEISLESLEYMKSTLNKVFEIFDPNSGIDKAGTRINEENTNAEIRQKRRRAAMTLRRESRP